jgi:hypothetical protein
MLRIPVTQAVNIDDPQTRFFSVTLKELKYLPNKTRVWAFKAAKLPNTTSVTGTNTHWATIMTLRIQE